MLGRRKKGWSSPYADRERRRKIRTNDSAADGIRQKCTSKLCEHNKEEKG